MRHFEDGDLVIGLDIARHNQAWERIEGEWHIVWTCIDGTCRTIDYNEPAVVPIMGISLAGGERKQKQWLQRQRPIALRLGFAQWNLEYEGALTDEMATTLSLVKNPHPNLVSAASCAVLTFGCVLDDMGHPFLQLNTSIEPVGCEAGSLMSADFVAKRNGAQGTTSFGLSKNERLRLGYPMHADGTFVNERSANSDEKGSLDSLLNQMGAQLEESYRSQILIHERIMADLQSVRAVIPQDLASSTVAPSQKPAPGTRHCKKSAEINGSDRMQTTRTEDDAMRSSSQTH